MKFTILGGTGFIGRRLASHLRGQGFEVETPPRDEKNLRGRKLGHVIYAIGLTGNFRTQLRETVEAHVYTLQRLMEGADFESWLYLSSTRVYGGLPEGTLATEDTPLSVMPSADTLYDLSKLLGESICLASENPNVRVVRLSNVYGTGQSQHTFLGSVIRDLARDGKVMLGEAPLSSKDYVSIDDVVNILPLIAAKGQSRLYNVASGKPVTHKALADAITQTGGSVDFVAQGPLRIFPAIDASRIAGEFGWKPESITKNISSLITEEKKLYNQPNARMKT